MKKKLFLAGALVLALQSSLVAQNSPSSVKTDTEKIVTPKKAEDSKKMETGETAQNSANDAAQAAITAHGGDKLKNLKSLQMLGTVDVSSSSMGINLSGTFAAIFSDEKYRLQISTPFYSFTQVSDGVNTMSNTNNFSLPAFNRIGLPLLLNVGKSGFTVSAVPNVKKGSRSFRITTPEGYEVDYTLEDKTNQVKTYKATYDINSRSVTTIIEHDKFKTVEGVVVPERYAQRFEFGEMSVYTDFKVKEIKVNSPIDDSVFTSVK